MRRTFLSLILPVFVAGSAATALAQGIPTTQPKFLTIFREQVKMGRAADHAKWEAGWPAALEKTKSPYNYFAYVSVTGPSEVWYVTPLASQAAFGEMMAREDADPALRAELDRLARGDAEFVSEVSALHAVARPELGHAEFPGHRDDALLGDHHVPRETRPWRGLRGGGEGVCLGGEALRAERELAHLRGGGGRPRRDLPRVLVGRFVRRLRQGDDGGRARRRGRA